MSAEHVGERRENTSGTEAVVSPTPAEVRLGQIEEREQKATPGPWEVDSGGFVNSLPARDSSLWRIAQFWDKFEELFANSAENATLIAHARADIPWLISELRKAWLHADINEQCARSFNRKQPFCEHENRYAFTEDGGKTGYCVQCREKRLEAALRQAEVKLHAYIVVVKALTQGEIQP